MNNNIQNHNNQAPIPYCALCGRRQDCANRRNVSYENMLRVVTSSANTHANLRHERNNVVIKGAIGGVMYYFVSTLGGQQADQAFANIHAPHMREIIDDVNMHFPALQGIREDNERRPLYLQALDGIREALEDMQTLNIPCIII